MNKAEPSLDCLEVRVVLFSVKDTHLQVLCQPAEGAAFALPGLPVPGRAGLEETAVRAVKPVAGERQIYLEQLYTYGDPARCAEHRLVSVVYFALIPGSALLHHPQDAAATHWFPIQSLPPMVYDHAEVVRYALRRLRYKLEYSAVGFELLPSSFTLSELQHIYEIILGETLDKRNFRRRILQADIIEATSEQTAGEGRPARLYRYRPDAVAEVKARRLFP